MYIYIYSYVVLYIYIYICNDDEQEHSRLSLILAVADTTQFTKGMRDIPTLPSLPCSFLDRRQWLALQQNRSISLSVYMPPPPNLAECSQG